MTFDEVLQDAKAKGTAFHEAGHAVACVVLGRPLTRASIVETEDFMGRVSHQRSTAREAEARGDRLEEASYSGPAGLDMPARTRRRVKRDVVIRLSGAIAEAKATGDQEVRAQRLMDFYWPEVEAVAMALLQRRTMSGAEVRGVIRSSLDSRMGMAAT